MRMAPSQPLGFRITLADPLFPLQAFLNAWPDSDFERMLWRMSEGIESTYNVVGWSWWGGEDDTPPSKGQLLFWVGDEELQIPVEQFLVHLRAALASWASCEPTRPQRAEALLKAVQSRLAD